MHPSRNISPLLTQRRKPLSDVNQSSLPKGSIAVEVYNRRTVPTELTLSIQGTVTLTCGWRPLSLPLWMELQTQETCTMNLVD